jgi:hypothetical protein
MSVRAACALAFACVALTRSALADPWDVGTINDDGVATRSELVHGSDEQHDLGAAGSPDQDWFRISQRPLASYEIVVDATGGDVADIIVERMSGDGVTVLQTAVPVGFGHARSLRFRNAITRPRNSQFIRVRSGGCGNGCNTQDVYRIRAYETTYSIARFNNTGTQVTVLLLQNPTDYAVAGTTHFWNADGSAAGTSPFNLGPRASQVLATQTVVPASSGSITISNDARYGDLTGKTVALEPATGFSFDTQMVPRFR